MCTQSNSLCDKCGKFSSCLSFTFCTKIALEEWSSTTSIKPYAGTKNVIFLFFCASCLINFAWNFFKLLFQTQTLDKYSCTPACVFGIIRKRTFFRPVVCVPMSFLGMSPIRKANAFKTRSHSIFRSSNNTSGSSNSFIKSIGSNRRHFGQRSHLKSFFQVN